MTLASRSGKSLNKEICVEINSLYTQIGAYVPSGPSVVGNFLNTITQPLTVTITPGAGGTVTSGGASFNLSGASANYLVTVSFNRKFSGSINFNATSLDNIPTTGSIDRICDASIGNPDILSSSVETIGNCLQSVLNNGTVLKTFGWSEVNEITSFTFNFQRLNLGSTVTISIDFLEKSIKTWDKSFDNNTVTYTDPLTELTYSPNLPTGVFEINCTENHEVVSYSKELCYKIGSQISFDYSANPAEAWDAYNGIRPRTDGVPSLPFAIGGFNFNEFSPDGKYLYSVSGASFTTHTYNGFVLSGFLTIPINFIGFPAAVGMTPVGLGVHPTTGQIYLMYLDGTRRLWLATLSITGNLQLVGDTQFVSVVTAPVDAHDITFTASGQLLLGHGSNLYLVDHTTGIINPAAPIALTGPSSNTFAVRNLSRYYNGDIHISGQDTGIGPFVLIYNGETYTKIRHWASSNSSTPPDSNISTAYPINPEVRFTRLYTKNVETNKRSNDDIDLVTGQPIQFPLNAEIKNCSDTVSREVSWVEDLCYVIDKNILSQGIIQVAPTGQIVSTACNPVAGFVPPAPLVYSSITHNLAGDTLYALDAGGTNLVTYNWTTITAPALSSTLPFTGLISVGETEKSLRTRWTDDTLWLMTEVVIGASRIFRFYIVNKATGALTLQGSATYPAGANNNGHFTWGVDDELYFSYKIGGGTYRVSKLSKVSYEIQNFVFDISNVVDNINVDLPSQRLLISKSGSTGIDVYSYSGQFISNCAGATPYQDAIHAPFGQFKVGDTIERIKKVFLKDLITGDVDSYYHHYVTGEDIVLPALARLIKCDNSVVPVAPGIPRFDVITGIVTWSKAISAPNAKNITITRLANNIAINDGITGVRNVNAAFSQTWSADKLGGNLTVAGTAAGSSFIIAWLE